MSEALVINMDVIKFIIFLVKRLVIFVSKLFENARDREEILILMKDRTFQKKKQTILEVALYK